jgi:hypothetical protein
VGASRVTVVAARAGIADAGDGLFDRRRRVGTYHGGPSRGHARQVNVNVNVDRPFGFLAGHRPSRLAVVAGWGDSPFRTGLD